MNRLIGLLNPQQWKLIGAMLLGSTGPLAWLLSRKLGMSDGDVKAVLDFAAVILPIVGGALATGFATDKAQVQAVAAMPADDKVNAVAGAQASIAASLPDKTIVLTASEVPGVQVHVDATKAPVPVIGASMDPAFPDVVPMTGGPVK